MTKLPTHAYQPDGVVNHRSEQACTCNLPKAHPVHVLPPVPADAAVLDARRLGESEDR